MKSVLARTSTVLYNGRLIRYCRFSLWGSSGRWKMELPPLQVLELGIPKYSLKIFMIPVLAGRLGRAWGNTHHSPSAIVRYVCRRPLLESGSAHMKRSECWRRRSIGSLPRSLSPSRPPFSTTMLSRPRHSEPRKKLVLDWWAADETHQRLPTRCRKETSLPTKCRKETSQFGGVADLLLRISYSTDRSLESIRHA